ncbi:MAG: hypothetical protein A3G32_07655 [Deltaproteobacteria bacterium RIFCSPLOWO2_12_FULL_40_28]|nr:MAG: hypothetical protein A3C45_00355 [Deltaproteobacteria bacterium RIFCSPHIGHO2_02_FULL_40_28]OGQ20791.1 MAG: hypothetical protein A3E27_03020 [Deltaproteobacteria bacterium RIFCSPHIGHO2_12_FULL_40_32]OGQ39192.1 MAG: hypothetical protein A3I69_04380 [Deltaproteobacteria bacterium RIFCSPLOWO2_02_FULL_40_36]OGQ54472.1 MAG: hypothetical protein A3G32_07655 [Deltaproteobacteria bacterium RIFCSPLOWO2_12_FULL_40_28]
MSTSTLTSKGQTTIPKDIRDFLQIDSGDRIDFIITDDQNVVIKPATLEVNRLRGMLHKHANGRKVSIDDMNCAIRARFKTSL